MRGHRFADVGLLSVANIFTQMMFVSGETGEVSSETTSMIEGIVQQQVLEMVCEYPDSN